MKIKKTEKVKINEAREFQKEFLRRAETLSDSDKFVFNAVYQTFITQIKILEDLEKSIEEQGTIVSKEYVKGRPCITVHPGITQYNNVSKGLGATVTSIYKILEKTVDDVPKTVGILEKLKEKNK